MKVAVIGGGSTYTPELIRGFADSTGRICPDEIVLVDPDVERLEVVGPFCARLLRASGSPGRVRWTSDLDEGLDGASAVLLQLRVGGQVARHRDESWPREYDCLGQETTGAGGLAKALRTIPVVLDIVERARRRADPAAWIIDFTNPVGLVTRALLDAGHRAVGLCNVAITLKRYLADVLDVAPDRVVLDHVGLNHLTWVRAVLVDGTDQLPGLLTAHDVQIAEHTELPVEVLREMTAIPSYYLRYFYCHSEEVAAQRGRPTRAEDVADIERRLLSLYADPARDHVPDLLRQRGGAFYSEAATALLDSLMRDRRDTQVVNLRNAGTFHFLPDEAVIEVPAVIGADGARPVDSAPLGPVQRGLVSHVAAYEELAVDAALRGGRRRIHNALLAHPLIGQARLASAMADRLIAENARYLRWVKLA